MTRSVERALRTSPSYDTASEILRIRTAPKHQRLDLLIQFGYRTVANDEIWAPPSRNSCNQTQPNQQKAARRLVNTLLIELPDSHEAPDPPLSKSDTLALHLKSTTVCTGLCNRDNTTPSTKTTTSGPKICSTCLLFKAIHSSDDNADNVITCKTCGNALNEDAPNPCALCCIDWLLQNNTIQQRLSKAKVQEASNEPPRKRVRFGIDIDENSGPTNTVKPSIYKDVSAGVCLTPKQAHFKACRNVGLPVNASKQDVSNRQKCKRRDKNQQAPMTKKVKLLQRRISNSTNDTRLGRPLSKKNRIDSELQKAQDLHRTAAATVRLSQDQHRSCVEDAPTRPLQPQVTHLPSINRIDLQSIDGNSKLNDNIVEAALKALGAESSFIHIVTPKFMSTLMNTGPTGGWANCKSWFQPTTGTDTLLRRQAILPSQSALILIIPVHTPRHWTLLIRDARGASSLQFARWYYFDTSSCSDRPPLILRALKTTTLFDDTMTWTVINTPQQATGSMDCGALIIALACGFQSWSSRLSHERLFNGYLQVTLATQCAPREWGLAARQYVRRIVQDRKLPSNHRATQVIRFKSVQNLQPRNINVRARASDFF